MKTEGEILQAIEDLTPVLNHESASDRMVAKIAIDAMNWVLGRHSVCGPNLVNLRQIRKAEGRNV